MAAPIRKAGMRKLFIFNFVTLDGYFEGLNRDISWHKHDAEQSEYAAEMLNSGDTLLFGRVTYNIMASYWPTPNAIENNSIVAQRMNNVDKIVFSRTLKKVEWKNTRLVKDNIEEEMLNLKLTRTRTFRNGNVLLCYEPF